MLKKILALVIAIIIIYVAFMSFQSPNKLYGLNENSNEVFLKGAVENYNSLVVANPTESNGIRRDKASSRENEFVQNFTLTEISSGELEESDVVNAIYPELIERVCSGDLSEHSKGFFVRNVTLGYIYHDKEGNQLAYMSIDHDTCNET